MAKAGIHRQSMDALWDAVRQAAGARTHMPLPLADLAHALVEVHVLKPAGGRSSNAEGRTGQASAHGCQAGQPAGEAGTAPLGAKKEGLLDGHSGLLKGDWMNGRGGWVEKMGQTGEGSNLRMAESKSAALEPVQGLFEAALGRNRDERMLRVHRMGSCPCKQPGRPIARFRPNPSGKYLAGRSAALRRLPIARAIGCAPRLAPHPGKVFARLQKDLEQVPALGDRSTKRKRRSRRQESNLQSLAHRPGAPIRQGCYGTPGIAREKMARAEGVEPSTVGFGDQCSAS